MSLADEMLAALNDPTYMWSHALRESSRDSQRLFLAMALLPPAVSVDDLQIAHSAEIASPTESFVDSLRTLEDSFIEISAGHRGARWVDFRNPSLQDFAYGYLNRYSDWLDTLLSSPVYYEQIVGVYSLAVRRSPGSWTTEKRGGLTVRTNYRDGPIAFNDINRWVAMRHERLISRAAELAASDSELHIYHYPNYFDKPDAGSKLKEIVKNLRTFGVLSTRERGSALSAVVAHALEPSNEAGANTIFELLRTRNTAEIIEAHIADAPMQVLRSNILDKDTWKFSVLSRIDEFLGIENEDSMADWGEDYISHAEELPYNMSGESDYDDYTGAIEELQSLESFLGINLHHSITALESARNELPPEEEEEADDYERYAATSEKRSSSHADPFRELDRIFSGLLE